MNKEFSRDLITKFHSSMAWFPSTRLRRREGFAIVAGLRANRVRVDADFSAPPFKAKISNAGQLRVHTILAIGGHDVEARQVSHIAKCNQYVQVVVARKTIHHFTPQLTRGFDSLHPLH